MKQTDMANNGDAMDPGGQAIRSFLRSHLKLQDPAAQYEKYLGRPGSLLAQGFTLIEADASFGKITQSFPEFHTVVLCASGGATLDGGTLLTARHITVIPAGRPFEMADPTGDFRATLLLFTPRFIGKGLVRNEAMDDLFSVEGERLPCYPLTPRDYADITAKLQGIAAEMENTGPFQREMVRLYLMQVLYGVNRVCEACLLRARYANSRKYRLAQEFRKLVDRHFRETRTVAAYASMLNITPKYLSECTQARYRSPAVKIIHARLLLESELLLSYSQMSIKEIVHILNFGTSAHFARFFRAYSGVTPAAYRGIP